MAGRRSAKKTNVESNALSISFDPPEGQNAGVGAQPETKLEVLGTHDDSGAEPIPNNGQTQVQDETGPNIVDSIVDDTEETHEETKTAGKPGEEKTTGKPDVEKTAGEDESDQEVETDTDGDKVYTKAQLKGILDRNTKKYSEQILDLQKQLEESKAQVEKALQEGLSKGKVSQRKTEIAKRFGFKETLLPDSDEGLDEFEKQMSKFEKGHERVIPAREVQREDESSWIVGAR